MGASLGWAEGGLERVGSEAFAAADAVDVALASDWVDGALQALRETAVAQTKTRAILRVGMSPFPFLKALR